MSNHINKEDKREYSILRRKEEAAGIVTLCLSPLDFARPSFTSGQFITVYFPELGLSEGKAYSVSSSPDEDELSITVKDIGAYSHKLCTLKEGETITVSGPYGFFYSEETESPLVLVAAGIGIAPFRGMVKDALAKNPSRKISLYYSVPKSESAIFLDTLSSFKDSHPNFTYALHITKESPADESHFHGRIPVEGLAVLYKEDSSVEYLICGSISFVRDMWKGLRSQGIPEDRLYTEAFFL